AMIDGEHFHRAERDFRVERDLRLELAVPATAAPGDEVEIGVVARDAEGRPVTAELSLALVDEALLAIAGPGAPAIVPFFRGELRETEFRTASSCTWSYRGASRPVNDELVAEERRAELEREVAEQQRLLVRGFAGDELDERPSVFLTQNEALGGAVAFDRRQLGLESLSQVQSATALPSLDWQAVVAGQFGVAGYFPATRDPAAASGNRRTDFRETGAWIAQLATDADGRASATVKLPDSTTAWQVRVAGVTLATEVGEATATLHSKRALQVGIVAPPLLLEGDEADVRLTAHNLGAAAVELELLWQLATGERGSAEQQLAAQTEVERLLHVAAGTGELRELELALSGRAAELSDEVRAAIPIVPFGIEMQDGAAGSTRDRARLLLGLPAGREYSALALTIDVGPDPGRDLIAAALDRGYLPHNCRMTQGTNLALAARGVAALQVLDYVEAAGSASRVERDSLRQAARGVVSALVGHQRDDGAYTWAGRSNPDLRSTCAAVRLFAAARAHGFEGTDEAFHRAGEWLQQQLRTAKAGPRADIVWALADAGEARFESLNSLLRVHSTLEADDLARLALAFQRFGRPEAAGEVLATLRDRLTALERLPLATVGLATAALLASDRRDVAGGRALAFLLAQRRGAGWGTPEATAAAIRAITLAERTGAGAPRALAVTVACNGVTLTPI
ncbi:MAG: hypothetical protein KDE27_25345, partial [Planctomycetes bacterium]|nr:hypothetical protein [Planctomycetota bacterium]